MEDLSTSMLIKNKKNKQELILQCNSLTTSELYRSCLRSKYKNKNLINNEKFNNYTKKIKFRFHSES